MVQEDCGWVFLIDNFQIHQIHARLWTWVPRHLYNTQYVLSFHQNTYTLVLAGSGLQAVWGYKVKE